MRLVAEFNRDKNGDPLSISSGGLNHYSLALKVKDAPASVRRVTYHLDPTYSEPVRIVNARVADFEEPMTTYGDFEVTVEYEAEGKPEKTTLKLSKALADGLAVDATDSCKRALEEIKEH